MGMEVPMGFPREWELDWNKDENGNGNTTTREWQRLMLVGSQNHSCGFVKYTLCFLFAAFTQRPILLSSVTHYTVVNSVKNMS